MVFFVHSNMPVDRRSAPINPDWILSGKPMARVGGVSRSQDGTVNTLFWDCTPGEFNWFYDRDETAYIIDGVAVLDEGLPTERYMRAGDMVYFPAGSQARWRVQTHLSKVAFVRRTLPRALLMVINLVRKFKYWRPGNARVPQEMFAFGSPQTSSSDQVLR